MKNLLITAAPGAGKSTAIRRVAEAMPAETLAGFYPEEMRSFPKTHRVGRYGVDVAAMDAAADAELAPREATALYLVDEIGKMECLAARFVAGMRRILAGSIPLVATIARRGGGFIAEVKGRRDCELRSLTRANRDAMPGEILAWLAAEKQ